MDDSPDPCTTIGRAETETGDSSSRRTDPDLERLLSLPGSLHEALKSERRRHVIACLHEVGRPVDVRTLASWVAAREAGTTVEDTAHEDQERVHLTLHHHHLPKLADYGLLDWNRADGVVELARIDWSTGA